MKDWFEWLGNTGSSYNAKTSIEIYLSIACNLMNKLNNLQFFSTNFYFFIFASRIYLKKIFCKKIFLLIIFFKIIKIDEIPIFQITISKELVQNTLFNNILRKQLKTILQPISLQFLLPRNKSVVRKMKRPGWDGSFTRFTRYPSRTARWSIIDWSIYDRISFLS